MAVAELCVGGDGVGVEVVSMGADGVVLLRNVLGQVWRDHLLNLLGLCGGGVLELLGGLQVSAALREAFVVVAMHEGGVGIG